MYFSPAFIAAAALYLTPLARADISRPNFTPTELTAPFLEQFTDDWTSRWQPSHAKKVNDKSTEEEWAYVGQWSVEEPSVLKGINGDKGLVLKDKAAHHAISAKFPTAIDNTGKTLVVQYEVKLQDGLECGGAYMKLLQDNAALQSEEFSNAAPYVIMFGPDKCGATNKVHFIFKHKNPITGEYEEKHLKDTPLISTDKTTSLYTLIVRPDQTFEIMIDGVSSRNGSLLESFEPAVNPDQEIDDPTDTKPSDWVDTTKIADPEAVKPEDWNEDEPYEIVDEDAVKPADWLEDEPTMIPDPEAEKPEDWDDEEDGDWVGPMVPNPKCLDAAGCGPWEKPMITNPAYKGKWTAPFIDNPLFKGIWKAARILNPSYYEDKTPANFEPIGAIGFEIWTMQGNILFDNIYIGHSVEDARKLKEQTFDVKIALEKEEEAASAPPPPVEAPKSPSDLKFADDPILYVREKVELFLTIAKRDPVEAIRFVPEVAGGAAVLAVTILTLLATLVLGGSSAPSVQQTKANIKSSATTATNDAASAKDQVAEAVATGAENIAADMNKRTTRSSTAATAPPS